MFLYICWILVASKIIVRLSKQFAILVINSRKFIVKKLSSYSLDGIFCVYILRWYLFSGIVLFYIRICLLFCCVMDIACGCISVAWLFWLSVWIWFFSSWNVWFVNFCGDDFLSVYDCLFVMVLRIGDRGISFRPELSHVRQKMWYRLCYGMWFW